MLSWSISSDNIKFLFLLILTDDDEIWSRISAQRKEILGKSSLWLRSQPPRNLYKVRFDLGSSVPVRAGIAEENEVEYPDERFVGVKKIDETYSTDQLLRNRINSLQSFLKQRKTRLRAARRRTEISSGLITSADLSVQNSKKSLQKARDVRFGEITHKFDGTSDAVCKEKTPKDEPGMRCEECHRLLKERDRFWGLESDSEDDAIKNFNEHVRRRSLRGDSRTTFEKKIGNSSSSPRYRENRARHKPKRIAGRGTWATPLYVPPWEVNEVDRRKARPIHAFLTESQLHKARFSQKKGK